MDARRWGPPWSRAHDRSGWPGPPWGAGPFGRRRPPVFFVPVIVAVIQLVGTGFAREHQGDASFSAFTVALLLAGPLALAWRRRFPIAVLLVVAAITGAYYFLDYPRGPAFLSFAVALFSAVKHGKRLAAWLVAGAALVGAAGHSIATEDPPAWGALGAMTVWLLLLISLGEVVRARTAAFAEASRVYAEEQRRRASDERLKIARELHDVLAHNISLINVQASVALHLLDDDTEQARTALATIKQASKDTLREMRSVLGVLRQVDEDAPRAPAPSLQGLDDVVSKVGAAGVQVEVSTKGEPGELPASVDQAAYRIIQEALTNVVRHSQATNATVHIEYSDPLTIRVDDDGPAKHKGDEVSGGNGIAGMTERATALGGEVIAVAKPGGGFRITARLPLRIEKETA